MPQVVGAAAERETVLGGMSAFFVASAKTALQDESWMIPHRAWKIRQSGEVPYLLMFGGQP